MAIYHGKTVLIAVFQGGASQIILKAFIFRSEFRGHQHERRATSQ